VASFDPKLRFLVDVDDVLNDLRSRVVECMTEVTGKVYTPEDFTGWDYFAILSPAERKKVDKLIQRKGFCLSLKANPEAQEAIKELKGLVNVFAVTAPVRGKFWVDERYTWLEREFNIPLDDVVVATSKYVISGRWFLDDRPSNIIAWCRGNSSRKIPMLWHTRATRDLGYDDLRVHSWGEVIERVKSSL
jgi:5'(3')-deoxyribonucleotidase